MFEFLALELSFISIPVNCGSWELVPDERILWNLETKGASSSLLGFSADANFIRMRACLGLRLNIIASFYFLYFKGCTNLSIMNLCSGLLLSWAPSFWIWRNRKSPLCSMKERRNSNFHVQLPSISVLRNEWLGLGRVQGWWDCSNLDLSPCLNVGFSRFFKSSIRHSPHCNVFKVLHLD